MPPDLARQFVSRHLCTALAVPLLWHTEILWRQYEEDAAQQKKKKKTRKERGRNKNKNRRKKIAKAVNIFYAWRVKTSSIMSRWRTQYHNMVQAIPFMSSETTRDPGLSRGRFAKKCSGNPSRSSSLRKSRRVGRRAFPIAAPDSFKVGACAKKFRSSLSAISFD